MLQDPQRALDALILLAARLGPSLLLLGWSQGSALLGLSLALGASLCILPSALPLAAPELQLWAALPWELARGAVLAIGALAPLLAFAWAGRISDAAGLGAGDAQPRPLARLYGLAALAVFFASGAHLFALRAVLGTLADLPLGSSSAQLQDVQRAGLGLGLLLARAFELGVVLAAPVLLVTLTGMLAAGLSQRVSLPLGVALLRGPLLPLLGISTACLCISSILGGLPDAALVFVDRTLALLSGLR